MKHEIYFLKATKLLLLLILLLGGIATQAQTTVQIGAAAVSGIIYSPIYRNGAPSANTDNRSDILYTQAELAAVGILPGAQITMVQFNKTNTANFVSPATFDMYMGNSSNTALTVGTAWTAIMAYQTLVYSNASYMLPFDAPGWIPWNLTSSFTYTGGSLEIAISVHMNGANSTTDAFFWENDANAISGGVPGPVIGANTATGVPPAALTGTSPAARQRPNIKITFNNSVKVAVKAFLQGAYNTGLGRHKDVTSAWASVLNANALSQPYNTSAFGNYAGTESVSAGFFTSTGATTDILDWVLVELHDATIPTTIIAQRAAFIREDGRIVDLDGTSDVTFTGVSADNYYVVVRHRNHLAIRSATAIALNGGTTSLYDFTTAQSQAYQNGAVTTNGAMQDVSGGGTVFAMWGGNANSNTTIRFTGLANDAGVILSALSGNQAALLSSTYNNADLNMDGTVRYTGLNNDAGALLSVLGSNQAAVYTQHQ